MGISKDEFIYQYKKQLDEIEDIPEEILQKYKVEACLNDSQGRQTFLLCSETEGEHYILKRILCDYGSELENEYTILSALQNPAFPKVISYFENGRYVYLLREYINGYNLYQAVESRGVFIEQKAVEIAISVCRSLSYLHQQSPPVIHRDVKPQNIIYTPEGKVVLIDMGAARRYKEEAVRDTSFMGTQATAAPEQYGFGQTDARCDIYAMGILLVFMLTGGFEADTKTLETISEPLRRVISRCIMFDPKKRYASVNILRLHLERCLTKRKRLVHGSILAVAGIALFFAGAILGWSVGISGGHNYYAASAASTAKVSPQISEASLNTVKASPQAFESAASDVIQSPQSSQTPASTPAQIAGIDDEISEAIAYGFVTDDIRGDWNDTITYKQYCTMIGNMLALKGSSYTDQWKTTASLALKSDQLMKRQEGMLALFYGGIILGETDDSGCWELLNDKMGKDCWKDFSWDYPLFPDWINKVYFSGQYWNNYMTAGYFFGMDARIKTSDKRFFDYDADSNSMLPKDPLNRRDAIHSVLRLYESTF